MKHIDRISFHGGKNCEPSVVMKLLHLILKDDQSYMACSELQIAQPPSCLSCESLCFSVFNTADIQALDSVNEAIDLAAQPRINTFPRWTDLMWQTDHDVASEVAVYLYRSLG